MGHCGARCNKELMLGMCMQNTATAAALEEREERIRSDEQELLAREEAVKKNEGRVHFT
jgi:hypothetical protein